MKITEKIRKAGLAITTLLVGFAFVSCSGGSQKTADRMMEEAIEKSTGEDVEVNTDGQKTTIETEGYEAEVDAGAKSWPGEIPSDVPEFTFGQINAVSTVLVDGNTTYTIAFREVKEGFIDKYDALLKEKGFTTNVFKTGGLGGSITAESEKYTIALMGNDGDAALSVEIKKQE
ncbi:MAG: hypothetical protein JXA03_14510 [Bacteroidales bacterium]|nr:hypothetical protein [Bacteroidales bacterium]